MTQSAAVDAPQYLTLLRQDGPALSRAARLAPDAPVAGCPGWDMLALVGHVGGIHQWVTEMLRTRSTTRLSRRDLPAPPGGAAVMDWYDERLAALVDVLAATDPTEAVWTFGPEGSGAGFWYRRMAQETALHRWDAEAAVGQPHPIDTDLAGDGVDEYLEIFVEPALARQPQPGLVGSLHLHSTDDPAPAGGGEWWLALAPERIERRHEHAKADAALRGPASDLLLWLWNRIPADTGSLQVFGDTAILDSWSALRY